MSYGPDDKIVRDAPATLAVQLAGILRARIERGDWQPDRAVTGEVPLSEQYGVSRPTVRRAIEALVVGGWLYTVPGRGTYVSNRAGEGDDQGDV
ncbi:GntR family transcriptional regulator [Streptomyces uncialis]|uniref:GntR family transcriptional regulator n=1 Tax=Streptomyces uncialis TaxID=1048205 RepID=UPI00224CD486|nr:GntR family transcriptional regulator [Streptomyces uncialis]MCX4663380.1 GntR family transcriptional regulator [Streptomyces uncialis]